MKTANIAEEPTLDLFHALPCFLVLFVENLRYGLVQIAGLNQEESIFPMFVTIENVEMHTKTIRIIKRRPDAYTRRKR